ncbi:MAG: exodeoxyribonuclease-5 [Patiriisocius sp.]|jgi:exodeoxyribonuclease-5
MLKTEELTHLLLQNLGFTPTPDQERAVYILSRFLLSDKSRCAFLLRGYAGTGKTSLMKALVLSSRAVKMKTFLMSPTGRAAKVLQMYTSKAAFTIHKSIYFRQVSKEGVARFVLKKNLHTNTIFIVDEASMISDVSSFSETGLLEDMILYVFSGKNCRLLIIGDQAQLPPVHLDISPALDEDVLRDNYNLIIAKHEMTQVMRQQLGSGILSYATEIRNSLLKEDYSLPEPPYEDFNDLIKIDYSDLQDEMEKCIRDYGIDNVKILTRSNKTANQYNQQIRREVMWLEEDIATEDQLMIVKNNYHWIEDNERIGFLANGDMLEVQKIGNRSRMYGLNFCDATLKLTDYKEEDTIDCKMLLDTLMVNGPSLPGETMSALYQAVSADYADEPSRKKRRELIKNDPWLNALQVKFSYAITCHKAQGGQWPIIFIDRGYFTDDMLDKSYLRWLYTALTRATKKVYFVNFKMIEI